MYVLSLIGLTHMNMCVLYCTYIQSYVTGTTEPKTPTRKLIYFCIRYRDRGGLVCDARVPEGIVSEARVLECIVSDSRVRKGIVTDARVRQGLVSDARVQEDSILTREFGKASLVTR